MEMILQGWLQILSDDECTTSSNRTTGALECVAQHAGVQHHSCPQGRKALPSESPVPGGRCCG